MQQVLNTKKKMTKFNMENKNDGFGLPNDKSVKPMREGEQFSQNLTTNEGHFNATTVEDLNKRILTITRIIKSKFPELTRFLDEMPQTIPSNKHPEISFNELNEYYQSIEDVLTKYKLQNPDR